jgi:hypothetical protein
VADPYEKTQISFEAQPGSPEGSSAGPGSAEPDRAELLESIRALSAQVGGLQSELQSLRAQSGGAPGRAALPPAGAGSPGWDDRGAVRRESSAWIRSLDGPATRQPAVPRLLLEFVFLVGVAVAAVIAELDALVIFLLMAAAWGLVALAEWFAAREARHRAELALRPLGGPGGVLADDPSWFRPPVERRLAPVSPVAGDDEDTEDGLTP